MSSDIKIKGQFSRPSFNYAGPKEDGYISYDQVRAQLCESMRNVCEDMGRTLKSIESLLRRIDRRLAVDRKLRRRAKGEAR